MPFWTVPDRDGGTQIDQVKQGIRKFWTIYGEFPTVDEADERCSHIDRRPPPQRIPVTMLKLKRVQRCSSDKGDIGEGTVVRP